MIAGAVEGEHHCVYLDLNRYIREQDRVMADCFDRWSRSNALMILLLWRRYNLITDEEFAGFSPETRARVG